MDKAPASFLSCGNDVSGGEEIIIDTRKYSESNRLKEDCWFDRKYAETDLRPDGACRL